MKYRRHGSLTEGLILGGYLERAQGGSGTHTFSLDVR